MARRSRGYAARNEARRKGRLEKTNKNGIIIITAVVIVFAIVIWSRVSDAGKKVDKLDKEIDQLEEQYEEQEERALKLEERKVYVQTKKYIEEVAKQLGLVYPDEIIYRPSE